MRMPSRGAAGVAAAALLVLGLTACTSPAAPASSTSSSASPTARAARPILSIAALSGVSTQVQLSQGFLDALTSLKLTATTLGTGVTVDQTFSFPVTGGNIDYYDPADQPEKMLDGTVEHVGSGISLRSGDTVVDLTDIRIDPGVSRLFATVSANGEVVADDVFVFRLDNSTFAPITENAEGDAVLAGGTVYVSPDAAALLRETFKSGEISEDLAIGSATFTLRAAPQE